MCKITGMNDSTPAKLGKTQIALCIASMLAASVFITALHDVYARQPDSPWRSVLTICLVLYVVAASLMFSNSFARSLLQPRFRYAWILAFCLWFGVPVLVFSWVLYERHLTADLYRAHNDILLMRRKLEQAVAFEGEFFGWRGRCSVLSGYASYWAADGRRPLDVESADERALSLMPASAKGSDPLALAALNRLGVAYAAEGRFNASLAYYYQLLKVCRPKVMQRQSVKALTDGYRLIALAGLAEEFATLGDDEKSESFLDQYIAAMNSMYSPLDRAAISQVDTLADLCVRKGCFEKAEPLAKQAMEFYKHERVEIAHGSSPAVSHKAAGKAADECVRYARILKGLNRSQEADKFTEQARQFMPGSR